MNNAGMNMAPDWGTAAIVWPAILAQALILGSAALYLLLALPTNPLTSTADALVRAMTFWWRALALVIFALFPLKLVCKTAGMAGVPLGTALGLVPKMLGETHAGRNWALQWPLTLGLVLAALLPMRALARASILAALCVMISLMRSYTSHAIDYGRMAVSVRFIHEVAAGLWAGALFGYWRGARRAGGGGRFTVEAAMALSRLAGWSVLLLILSGLYISYTSIGLSFEALIRSNYGQILIVKVVTFVLILAIAGYNRYLLMPVLDRETARVSLIRNVGFESLAMVAVMALATLLANTAPVQMTETPMQMTRARAVIPADPPDASGTAKALSAVARGGWHRRRRTRMIELERVGVVMNRLGLKFQSRLNAGVLVAVLFAMIAATLGCGPKFGGAGSFPAATTADCLPDITLVDQNGRNVSLASLKGKPVLVDFIYTECPGPCLMLTSKMVNAAKLLRTEIGTQVQLVSISIDPAHDTPAALTKYAREQGADLKGWLFLTGTPQQIDQVLTSYNLRREVEPNGLIDHVVEFFLLGPDGRQLRQYAATEVTPETLASDVRVAIAKS